MRVHRKIKKSGDIVGVYQYEKGFNVCYNRYKKYICEEDSNGNKVYYKTDIETGELIEVKLGRKNQGTLSKEEELSNRKRVMTRNKNDIRDLVNSNAYAWSDEKHRTIRPKFLTLTFKDNVTDLDYANREFKKFIQRLNRHIKKDWTSFDGVQYVAVVEFQKRGAVHYHLLLFNMPYIEWSLLLDKWGLGGAYIEGFKDKQGNTVDMSYDSEKECFVANNTEVHNIGAYITKTMEYMSKSLDDERLKGRKCYFTSRGLKKSLVINDTSKCSEKEKEIVKFADSLSPDNKVFSNTYFNEHVGMVHYEEYNIKFKGISSMKRLDRIRERLVRSDWCSNTSDIKEL